MGVGTVDADIAEVVIVVAVVVVNHIPSDIPADVTECFDATGSAVQIQHLANRPQVRARLVTQVVDHALPMTPDVRAARQRSTVSPPKNRATGTEIKLGRPVT